MEGEAVQGEMLAMAMAARNSGGIVIAQVTPAGDARQPADARRQGAGRARRPRLRGPGPVADLHHPATRRTTRASCAGRSRRSRRCPLDIRKIIARRSLLEFPRGAICNLGFGISQLIGRVAWEEGITDQLVLTVEQGIFGGVAGGRQRGRRRLQLPGDDRPAVHVRLLRRRRPRRRQPVVRRGRRRGQRQRPRLRGPRPRSGRLPEHQREDRQDQLRRDAHRARPRDRHRRRRAHRAAKGSLQQVRAGGPRDLVQRAGWPASAASRSATSPSGRSSRSRTTAWC